jgi:DNA-binding response OmpR family regulator
VGDGLEALERTAADRPDLVVLDLMLPGLDGIEVCRRMQRDRHVPVLMLTARDDEADLLVGLAVGADDYLTKPFSMRELEARVAAILRRVTGVATEHSRIRLADVVLDESTRLATRAGDPVHLTPTEFDLVVALARRRGAVRTREQLLADVWGYRDGSGVRTVDSHVRALRRKLGDDVIRTVHGVGYAVGNGDG